MDQAKLEAAGFKVLVKEGGAYITAPGSREPAWVKMEGTDLVLALERSAFHREINAALGRENPEGPPKLTPEEIAALGRKAFRG